MEMALQLPSKVYIVVLNWNGWRDTLECLESLFRLEYPNFRVIVCDNNSSDGSIEKIQGWAEGAIQAPKSANPQLASISYPPVRKPVGYSSITVNRSSNSVKIPDLPLVIVQTRANLGFAGGNNVALRSLLSLTDW